MAPAAYSGASGVSIPAVGEDRWVDETAALIGGKWTIPLIRDLAAGRHRFSELERSLHGISPRTLSLRLRTLEAHGLVTRNPHYALTEKGEALLPLIDDMRAYGRDWLDAS